MLRLETESVARTSGAAQTPVVEPQAEATTPVVRPLSPTDRDVYVGPRSLPSAASEPKLERPVLLFNSECSVCRTISGWVIASDEPKNGGDQALDERPIGHDPDALKKLHPNLDIWDAYAEITLVMPSGEIKKGGEAIAEVLRRLPSTKWMGPLFDLEIAGKKPFVALVHAGYVVLDRLRPALGCESCGTGVPWWGKPIEWAFKGWKAMFGSKEPPASPSPPTVTTTELR
jgi:hypothetical protein